MSFSTTSNELFIVETAEPFSSMPIQFVPRDMSNNRKAKLSDVEIVGRNDDLQHYISGQETLSFVVEMYGDKTMVIDRINWLKSLTMNDGFGGSYRSVKLIFGELFKYQVWDINSVSTKMTYFTKEQKWLPTRADVTINMRLNAEKNRFIQDVRNGR